MVPTAERPAAVRSHTPALIALCVAVFAYSVTQTMLVPTTGRLQHDLNTTPALVTWAVLTAPLLVSAAVTPLVGELGDRYGKRRTLLVVLTVFGAATIGCIASPGIWWLMGFRALQGVALGILPLAFGLISDTFPPARLGRGLALASSIVGGSAGLGLVGGGVVVDHLSWRWLFVIALTVIVVAAALVARWAPESTPHARGRIDLPGAALLAASLLALLLGLTQGPAIGWSSAWVIGLLIGSVAVFFLFLRVEARIAHPLMDPTMLIRRPIVSVHLVAVALGATQFAQYVLIPKYITAPYGLPAPIAEHLGYGFGRSITVVGLVMLPGTLATLLASPALHRIAPAIDHRAELAIGMALGGAGALLLVLVRQSLWEIIVGFVVSGAGFGLSLAVLPKLVHEAAPPRRAGAANGINTVARTSGGAIGTQVAAAVLATVVLPGTTVPTDAAYSWAFGTGVVFAAIGVVLALTSTTAPTASR